MNAVYGNAKTKSLIIPVYRNEKNIPALITVLRDMASREGGGFEVVFIVDGSPDRSRKMLESALPEAGFASSLIVLEKNIGPFAAIRTALAYAEGEITAVMSADLQEPPELIHTFFRLLEQGKAELVCGRRTGRGDGRGRAWLANVYWKIFRSVSSAQIPRDGADVFGFTSEVKRILMQKPLSNSLFLAGLFSCGKRPVEVPYRRRKRLEGRSAWSFGKQAVYVFDNLFFAARLPARILFFTAAVAAAAAVTTVSLLAFAPAQQVFLPSFILIALLLMPGFCFWRAIRNGNGPEPEISAKAVYAWIPTGAGD